MSLAMPQLGPGPLPAGSAPGYGHAPVYADAPPVYNYAYNVVDSYAGLNFGQSEGRDGYATKGEYHVQLPDGRLQTVVYHVADDYSGYVADVSYSGTPTYGPAPVPHLAPAPILAPGPIRGPAPVRGPAGPLGVAPFF